MESHIDWLGCATFRLKIAGLTLFLDTYMNRVPSAPKVGLSAENVTEADFILIGHNIILWMRPPTHPKKKTIMMKLI